MPTGPLCALLLAWWDEHGRHDIPWKRVPASGQPDPYGIWIAEVMLQQTQLQVALPYWQRWMQALPTLDALASADEQQVLLLWQGLGYYSRARRLHQAAQQLQGQPWPQDLEAWLALPGIGRSTAGSILSSAFDWPFAILDGNVKRVLARLTAFEQPPARHSAHFWSLSEQLLDRQRPRDFNQALMDLGATLCTPRQPDCPRCPWQSHCAAYAAGSPEQFPVKESPKPLPLQVIGVGVVLNEAGEVLIDQRLNEGLLGGLWEFPGGKLEPGERPEEALCRELKEELQISVDPSALRPITFASFGYPDFHLLMPLYEVRDWQGELAGLEGQEIAWAKPAELASYKAPPADIPLFEELARRY